jgi:hypothetical protein
MAKNPSVLESKRPFREMLPKMPVAPKSYTGTEVGTFQKNDFFGSKKWPDGLGLNFESQAVGLVLLASSFSKPNPDKPLRSKGLEALSNMAKSSSKVKHSEVKWSVLPKHSKIAILLCLGWISTLRRKVNKSEVKWNIPNGLLLHAGLSSIRGASLVSSLRASPSGLQLHALESHGWRDGSKPLASGFGLVTVWAAHCLGVARLACSIIGTEAI